MKIHPEKQTTGMPGAKKSAPDKSEAHSAILQINEKAFLTYLSTSVVEGGTFPRNAEVAKTSSGQVPRSFWIRIFSRTMANL